MTAETFQFLLCEGHRRLPKWRPCPFRILSHRTKFVAKEDGSAQSNPLLTVKDGPGEVSLIASAMNGISGSDRSKPTSDTSSDNNRRVTKKAVLNRNPSAKISQLG